MLNWFKNTFSKSQQNLKKNPDTKSALAASQNVTATSSSQEQSAVLAPQKHATPDAVQDPIAIAYKKLQSNPADNLSIEQLADMLYERGLFPESEALYRLISQSQPESIEAWINLGLSLDRQSRFEEALACYRHVIAKNPLHAIAHFNLGVSLSSSGQTKEAEQAYLRALAIDPLLSHAHFNLGMLFQQRGHLNEAIHHYQQVLQIDSKHYYAYCNLGVIHASQSRLTEAESFFLNAIAAKPDASNADFFLFNLYQQQGHLDDAESTLKNLLQRQPDNFTVHDTLLNQYMQQRRFADAANIYRQKLAIMPSDPITHYNLGVVLKEQGLIDEALHCYQQAVRLKPDFAEAHGNLGAIFQEQGKPSEAQASYQRSLECNPKLATALTGLGQLFDTNGQIAEAEASYRKAVEVEPNHPDHYCNLGRFLFQRARYDESESCFRQALKLNPDSTNALYEYGRLHMLFDRLTAARLCFEQALRINPGFSHCYNSLGALFDDQGMIPEAIAAYRSALEHNPNFSEAYGNLLFSLNYHPDLAAEEIFVAYQEYERRFAAPYYPSQRPHANTKRPDRRLKIAYVSPDLRRHPVQHFLEPLLAHHDKSQFEVYAYSELAAEDAVSARYRDYVNHWISTSHMSDEVMVEKIRTDNIDILIDLAGHTGNNRLRVFACKPAPVSLSWLGYGYTTGITALDYFLSDPVFTPEGTDALFAEKIWRVDNPSLVYRPAEGMGAVSVLPALANGYITLGTLSRAVRINHRVIRTWANILQCLDNAKLVIDSNKFKDETLRKTFIDKFAALGIDHERILIGAHSPPWDMLRNIDIGLDCFPHNSGTTLFETLYMGVPFVTMAGRPSVGRLGSSILQGLGRPEWIATSEDDYVDKVVTLASNLDHLNTIRLGQRKQMQNSKLMDEVGFTRKIEAAYRLMWQDWCLK